MVLQNKYKARASRRYNAARGGASDQRGRGRGGRGPVQRYERSSFPSLTGQEEDDEDGEGEGTAEEEGGGEDEEEEARSQRAKFAPRKLVSNAWRYAEPEPSGEGEDGEPESEDEVDLSGLLERVAKLDSSRTSKTLTSSENAAMKAIQDDADDIDVSLLHLLSKQRARRKGDDGSSEGASGAPPNLTEEQIREMEEEGRRLLDEKARREKHERRARVLKQSAKSISVDIGDARNNKEGKRTLQTRERLTSKGNTLYDVCGDEDEAEDNADDTEAFLAEISGLRNGAAGPEEHKRADRESGGTAARPSVQSGHIKKADEDFLDSIL